MHQSEAVRWHLNQLSIICGAIFGGVALFAGVVGYLLFTGAMPPEDMDLPSWMGTLFNLVALVVLLKAHFLPRLFSSPGQAASEVEAISRHKRNTIVAFALREGAAFVALVGALLTGQTVGATVMVGLAMVTMVLAWPREEQLKG